MNPTASGTEPQYAPATMPRQMKLERQGAHGEPITRRFPQVRGGVCEYCGVIDPNVDSVNQYKLCSHYRGLQLRCYYCDANKNPDEVIQRSTLNVAESPTQPGSLVVWCDSFECSKRHLQRFRHSA